MLNLVKNILWLLSCAFLLLALFFAGRLTVSWLKWPYWTAFFITAGAVTFFYGACAYIRQWRKRRECIRAIETLHSNGHEGRVAADPLKTANMRLIWQSGLAAMSKSRLAGAAPWYISMGGDNAVRARLMELIDIPGAQPPDSGHHPDFTWHFARKAVWLDMDTAVLENDDGRWPLFLAELAANLGNEPLAGLVYALDTKGLVESETSQVKKEAALFRRRLDQLIRALGTDMPVYLLVDRIDTLYGVRSLIDNLSADDLDDALGAIRLDKRESPGAFSERAVENVLAYLARKREAGSFRNKSSHKEAIESEALAAFQGVAELRRLEKPLATFCREAFGKNPYQVVSSLRGIFFGTSEIAGTTLPAQLSGLSFFRPLREAVRATRPLFFENLLAEYIPSDPAPYGEIRLRMHRRAVAANAGLTVFLIGTLVLCWLMSCAFVESRSVLASLSPKMGAPGTAGELRPFLKLAMETTLRNAKWWLPRFGMDEAEMAGRELRRRYLDGYCDLKALPNIERIGKRATAAVRSREPGDIGNALLAVLLMRKGLADIVEPGDRRPEDIRRIAALFGDPRRPSNNEQLQLEMYLQWADKESWMTRAITTLVAMERHIINNAMDGDIMRWLPEWVDGMAEPAPIDAASIVWHPVSIPQSLRDRWTVRPAWSAGGFKRASDLLDAVVYDAADKSSWPAKRDAVLAAYRHEALQKWQGMAAEIWRGYQSNIADANLDILLAQAANGDDPASRMSGLLREHLLPMYPPDSTNPEIRWLRESAGLLPVPTTQADGIRVETGMLSRIVHAMADIAAKVGSTDEVELLSRNLSVPDGKANSFARDNAESLLKSFKEIFRLAGKPETSLDCIRKGFLKSADAPAAPLPVTVDGDNAGAEYAWDQFEAAKRAAENLNFHLRRVSQSSAWLNISPTASYNFVRYLATRRAALHLDKLWREKVFSPSMTRLGTGHEKFAQLTKAEGSLEKFLGETSIGLWRLADGRLINNRWDNLPFMFNSDFLDFVNKVIAAAKVPARGKMRLPFKVEAVSVDRHARERPIKVDFIWNEKGEEQILSYRNFAIANTFEWHMDTSATARIVIEFPSLTIAKEFSGESAIGDFVRGFASGTCELGALEFPLQREALERLGVGSVAIRVAMQNGADFQELFDNISIEMPYTIVTPGGGREKDGGQSGQSVARANGPVFTSLGNIFAIQSESAGRTRRQEKNAFARMEP